MTTTSIKLLFRPSSKSGKHPGSLFLRLIHQRRVKTLVLAGCYLYSEEWDKKTQTVISSVNDSKRNTYLKDLECYIGNEITTLNNYIQILENEGAYTVDDVVSLYKQKKDTGKLLGYTELLAKELEHRGQERTARAYRTVAKGMVKFNKGVDIPLNQINACLMKGFEVYLKENSKLPNTISYYMRNLRAIYNKAVNSKQITHSHRENPFAGVYSGITKTMKRALTPEEMHKLHTIDFDALLKKEQTIQGRVRIENLQRAWLYFFFCFHARGMCFIDLSYLRKDNIHGDIIKYCRKKTGRQIEVRITPHLRGIIERFAKETVGSPYLFPIIKEDGQKPRVWYENALRTQNNRLKTLAEISGISKIISTHVVRHSWATIGKQKNVPLRVLSECLGHSSENTTLIYLGSLNNTELDKANDIITSAVCY